MKNLTLAIAVALAVAFTPAWSAAESDDVKELKEKVESLEERQAELYHSLAEKKSPGLLNRVGDKITFGGLIETEIGYTDTDPGTKSSDIVLATVELGIDAEVHEFVTGHILLLWEEDAGPIAMDEGTIRVGSPSMYYLTVGKKYLPFGNYNSHMISDPETLELGETNASVVEIGYETTTVEIAVGFFNGSVDEVGNDDKIDDFYFSAKYTASDNMSFGVSYISDIADTDGDVIDTNSGNTLTDVVAGYAAFASITAGKISVEAEYLAAADNFDVADLDVDGDGGDEPTVYNLEVAFAIGDDREVAVRFEGNEDFFAQPETQYGIAYSRSPYENVSVGVEFLQGEFDIGDVERTVVTAQLAIEF